MKIQYDIQYAISIRGKVNEMWHDSFMNSVFADFRTSIIMAHEESIFPEPPIEYLIGLPSNIRSMPGARRIWYKAYHNYREYHFLISKQTIR